MRSRFVGWVAVLVLCAATPPGISSASPAPTRVLPTQWCGDHIVVHAQVSGDPDRPLTMILDTGSNQHLIDPESLSRVGNVTVAEGKTARFEQLQLGDVRLSTVQAVVHDMDHLSRAIGMKVDGLLGYPAFRKAVLTLDYPASEVRLATSGEPLPDHDTVLRMRRGKRRPWVRMRVGDGETWVLVDSGASRGFSLSETTVDWNVEPVTVGALTGFRGLEPVRVGRAAIDIVLGVVRFEAPAVRGLRENQTQTIGAKVLSRFVVVLDGPRRRILFHPAESSSSVVPSTPLNGFGLGWKPNPEDVEVVSVMAGGPGELAGFQVGDRVIAVNGRPVSEPDACAPRFPKDGPLNLLVRRGEDEFPVELSSGVLVP